MKTITFSLFLILSACSIGANYQSDDYKIRQRQRESLKMFEKTQRVRRKCSKGKVSGSSRRRKKYYSCVADSLQTV